jgi:hypothetical protein
MNRLGHVLALLDHSLGTKKKKHLAGGILLSVSILFGGLAVTVITLKMEDEEEETFDEYLE